MDIKTDTGVKYTTQQKGNMKFLVSFEYPHGDWIPLKVFKKFFDWIVSEYNQIQFEYYNPPVNVRSNPSGPYSPHIMRFLNKETNKYSVISYWDRAIELTWRGNGWSKKNQVQLITSSGVHQEMQFTPFSYVCYSKRFEDLSSEKRKKFDEKKEHKLLFRGALYSDRFVMSTYRPDIVTDKKIELMNYFDEINNSRINLSLNGAGEICNRDMEILSCGSVLMRPKLRQKFYNDLIPDYHYISVEPHNDPKIQLDYILEKYEEIKDNDDYLRQISLNGLEWYLNNGTIDSNVEILKKLQIIENLI
jgi:hypothetical protein